MNIDDYIKQPLPFEEEILKYFKPTDKLVIFDIGACEGEDSIKLQRLFPKADVYSFEPLPKNTSRIKDHFKKYGLDGRRVYQLALSDKNGEAEFYVSSGHPGNQPKIPNWDFGNKSSSLLAPKEHIKIHEWVKFNQKINVKTQRLDSFCKKHDVNRIDFAFLDVQGAELMVLNGAGEQLKNIGAIWLEVEAVELYDKQPLKHDVELFMQEHGFLCIKSTVDATAGDQLYINKAILKLKGRNTNLKRKLDSLISKKYGKISEFDNDIKMVIPKDMAWSFDHNGYYEKNVMHWIYKLAKNIKEPVFYDIGANIGYYSLTLSAFCKQCYSFEPVRSTHKVLRANVRINGVKNIKTYKYALSNKAYRGFINVYNSSGNNSAYLRNLPEGHPTKLVKKESIEFVDLDNLVKSNLMLPPSLIKIDIEGGELSALKGAKKTIKAHMPAIIIEYSDAISKDAGYKRLDLFDLIKSFGYKVYGLSADPLDNNIYPPNTQKIEIDNLIAVPKTLDLRLL